MKSFSSEQLVAVPSFVSAILKFSRHDTLRLLDNNLFNLMLIMMAGIVTVADIMNGKPSIPAEIP